LGRSQRPRRREPEATVGIALEAGQVVEERRRLALLAPLDRGDDARPSLDLLDDLVGSLGVGQAGRLAGEPATGVLATRRRIERRLDQPVVLGHERLDLEFTA